MRIAAIGDSVMWGQGLNPPLSTIDFEDEEKFVFKIVEWLKNEGKVQNIVMSDFLAHSGAVIGTPNEVNRQAILSRDEAPNKKAYDNYYGEIPDEYPTVLGQLSNLKNSSTIDILIINGGPNDVGILNSIEFSEAFNKGLELIDEVARVKLPILFEEASKKCPNAIILYMGYYAAITNNTSNKLISKDLNILAPVLRYLPIDKLFLAVIDDDDRIKEQGLIFHQRILAKFREQIAIFNEKRNPSLPPILFCPSGFGNSSAMWAPNQNIFTFDDDLGVSGMRKSFCEAVNYKVVKKLFTEYVNKYNVSLGYPFSNLEVKRTEDLFCKIAYVAHPNRKGAEQYYRQLKKRIEVQLIFSLRNHLESMETSISSLRKLKEKYPFVPLTSLRGLSDVLWLDVISIGYHKSSSLGYSIPSGFLSTLDFDFGWGYQKLTNQKGLFVLDVMDRKRLSALKYVKIQMPEFEPIVIKLSIDFYIKINGYPLPNIELTEKAFKKIGNYRVWEMPTLNFKQENA
tara:strand:- start:1229 stop:2764 length:1536 start_codon:yes stop_codon:yes gene_type:complete